MFHEDTRNSFSDQAGKLSIAHVGSHEQYFTIEVHLAKAVKKVRSPSPGQDRGPVAQRRFP